MLLPIHYKPFRQSLSHIISFNGLSGGNHVFSIDALANSAAEACHATLRAHAHRSHS